MASYFLRSTGQEITTFRCVVVRRLRGSNAKGEKIMKKALSIGAIVVSAAALSAGIVALCMACKAKKEN